MNPITLFDLVVALATGFVAFAALLVAALGLLLKRLDRRFDAASDDRRRIEARLENLFQEARKESRRIETKLDSHMKESREDYLRMESRLESQAKEARQDRTRIEAKIDGHSEILGGLRQDVGRLQGLVERGLPAGA